MSVIWKDGNLLDGTRPQVGHDDSGFINGLGVFDSMLAKDGVLLDAGAHFDRLLHDIDVVLGFGASWLPGFVEMTNIWIPLLSENRLTKGYARIKTIVTGGMSAGPLTVSNIPSVVVSVAPSGAPESVKPAVCAIIPDFPRVAGDVLENCKRLDYSRSFAARREARAAGADDAIITNTHGNIACGSTSNVFIREGARLVTPPLSEGVLAGVTRKMILQGQNASEDVITPDRLRAADEVFLTNSFTGMRKVSKIL